MQRRKEKKKGRNCGELNNETQDRVDYTANSTVLAGPHSAATISPHATPPTRASRVRVYITIASVGTVSVDIDVVWRSSGCRGGALLDTTLERVVEHRDAGEIEVTHTM